LVKSQAEYGILPSCLESIGITSYSAALTSGIRRDPEDFDKGRLPEWVAHIRITTATKKCPPNRTEQGQSILTGCSIQGLQKSRPHRTPLQSIFYLAVRGKVIRSAGAALFIITYKQHVIGDLPTRLRWRDTPWHSVEVTGRSAGLRKLEFSGRGRCGGDGRDWPLVPNSDWHMLEYAVG